MDALELPSYRGVTPCPLKRTGVNDPRAGILLAAAMHAVSFVLKTNADFIPFGLDLKHGASKPQFVAYDPGGEHITDDYSAVLLRVLHKRLAEKDGAAAILTIEGTTRRPGRPPGDSMLCRIDIKGAESIALVVLYTRSATGNVTFGGVQRIPLSEYPQL